MLDLDRILTELKSERDRIGRAISALQAGAGVVRRGRPRKDAPKKRAGMTPEGRRRISLAMKRRWAEKKKLGY